MLCSASDVTRRIETMTTRRISVQDYPEHLNPFYENYNGGAEITNKGKYNTWSLAGKYKIKHTLDKSWAALHSSPGKSKIGRKLSFLKAVTVDKLHLHGSKKKSTPALTSGSPASSSSVNPKGSISAVSTPSPTRYNEPFIIMSPKQKEKLRQQRLATEADAAAATAAAEAGASSKETDTIQENGVNASPSHSGKQEVNHVDSTVPSTSTELVVNGHSSRDEESLSDAENCYSATPIPTPRRHHVADELLQPKSGVNSAVSTPLLDRSYDSQGVRPKLRKKRAAPQPPQEENKSVAVESEKGSPVEPEMSNTNSNSNQTLCDTDHHKKQPEINGSDHHHNDDNIQISTAHVVLSSPRKSYEYRKPLTDKAAKMEESKENGEDNNSSNNSSREKTEDEVSTNPEDEINNNREKVNRSAEENNNIVPEDITSNNTEKEQQSSETTLDSNPQPPSPPSSTSSETVKTNADKLQIDA